MKAIPLPSTPLLAAMTLAVVLKVALPPLLAAAARRHLGVSWRYFGLGALTFLLSQLATRVPLTLALQSALDPLLEASAPLRWAWLLSTALTAGLFEECGRYAAFRWLMRREEKTWPKAVMFGLGHGGLESMLYVAGITLVSLVGLAELTPESAAALPAERRTQLAALTGGPPWLPLLGVWERAWALALHVGFSVLVLQAFRRGRLRWLGLAIAAHTIVDVLVSAVPHALGRTMPATLAAEAAIALLGLAALLVARALREPARAHRLG